MPDSPLAATEWRKTWKRLAILLKGQPAYPCQYYGLTLDSLKIGTGAQSRMHALRNLQGLRYTLVMTKQAIDVRIGRIVLAVGLVAVAILLIIVEPFPKGFVLLPITERHGIDAGDLPSVVLFIIAAWLTVGWRARP